MTVTAAQFVEFLKWIDEDFSYPGAPSLDWDDCFEWQDGVWVTKHPDALIDLSTWGDVEWEGKGPAPELPTQSVAGLFRHWMEKDSNVTLVIRVPKAHHNDVLEYLNVTGGQVIHPAVI
jgi:hypothetical protein